MFKFDSSSCKVFSLFFLLPFISFVSDDIKLLGESELEILKDVCIDNNIDFELVKKILYLEKNSYGLTRRDNLQKELARLLNQDYIHI